MASMIAATYAAANLYSSTPGAKNWMVTALVAKWGVDQLKNNGVSVAMGKDVVEFIKQPNGVFVPPGNSTMTLTQTNSAYNLQVRHGNTFKFDSLGRLTNIVDQYSQPLTITYNASNLGQHRQGLERPDVHVQLHRHPTAVDFCVRRYAHGRIIITTPPTTPKAT